MKKSALKTSVALLSSAVLGAMPLAANATLLNGIVDTWTVDVSTIFDAMTVQPGAVTVVNSQSLRWGTDLGFGLSGLDITDSPSSESVDTNGPSVNNVSFTHINNPIQAPSLTSVDVLSTLTLTPLLPPALGLPPVVLTFPVHFSETPNGDNPCADGGANGVGVNINGCADIFVIGNSSLNFPFMYDLGQGQGPMQYFISFFESTNGLNPLSTAACSAAGAAIPCLGFETPEQATTTFTFAALITTERVTVVPEPVSIALFGIALAGMGFARRRR